MRSFLFLSLCCVAGFTCLAQSSAPVVLGAGNTNPLPIPVAPGELLTLFVQPAVDASTVTLADVSAVYSNGADLTMPVVRVDPATVACAVGTSDCGQSIAVTLQVPFGIQTVCNVCANPLQQSGSIAVTVKGVKSAYVPAEPFQDHVHFLTACDVVIAGATQPAGFPAFPCQAMITHADGSLVTQSHSAKIGEELVAYATGLGQTNPALTTGQPAAASSPTTTTFLLDFNYHPNALPVRPLAASVTGFAPVFTGATQGFVGLYQINFIVPAPPPGTLPCVASSGTLINGNVIQTNLTVSAGSVFSFGGAGICVATVAVDPPGSGS